MTAQPNPIDPVGLAAAIPELTRWIRPGAPPAETVLRSILAAYLRARTKNQIRQQRVAPASRILASMAEGQEHHFPPTAMQCIRGRMKTARVLADNRHMKWWCQTLPNGEIRVTRLEDNAPLRRPVSSPITIEMMMLQPGRSRISEAITSVRGRGQMATNHKAHARKYLDDWNADWSVRTTSHGIRLTRTR